MRTKNFTKKNVMREASKSHIPKERENENCDRGVSGIKKSEPFSMNNNNEREEIKEENRLNGEIIMTEKFQQQHFETPSKRDKRRRMIGNSMSAESLLLILQLVTQY